GRQAVADRLRVRRVLHAGEHGPRRAAEDPLEPVGHVRVARNLTEAARPGGRHHVLRSRPGAVGDDTLGAGPRDLRPAMKFGLFYQASEATGRRTPSATPRCST